MIGIDDIKKILIVGTGTMGPQIGLQCAMHGYTVTLYDVDQAALDTADSAIDRYLTRFVADGKVTNEQASAIRDRIDMTIDAAAAAVDADLINESVPEDPVLKAQVFSRFNRLCPPHTLFTTNTSTLLPSKFAAATKRPSQLAALHFHLPVWQANVVDVMPHAGTDPDMIPLLVAFAYRIGQIPIVLEKEHSGYVYNHMLSALLKSAIYLVTNNISSVADVDRAWMGIMNTPAGPFGIIDSIGIDTVWRVTNYWAGRSENSADQAGADFLKQYVEQGKLGVKSGSGFYEYPNPAYASPEFVDGAS